MEQETSKSGPGQIPERVYFRIGDVADIVGVKPYVLRYWESEFPMIAPEKSSTGQRVYRRGDVETLLLIKHLLYQERYSIEGARRRLRELRRDGELKSFKQEKVIAALAASSEAMAEEARMAASEATTLAEVAESLRAGEDSVEMIEVHDSVGNIEIVQFSSSPALAVPVPAVTPAVSSVSPPAEDPERAERLGRMRALAEELHALATVPVSGLFPPATRNSSA